MLQDDINKKQEEINQRGGKSMDDFVVALDANTLAVRKLESRFDVFAEQAKQRQDDIDENREDIEKLEICVKGNGKPGVEARLSRLEIYASIIVGLMSTGVIGVVGYVIVKGVELVYTHNLTP